LFVCDQNKELLKKTRGQVHYQQRTKIRCTQELAKTKEQITSLQEHLQETNKQTKKHTLVHNIGNHEKKNIKQGN